VKWAFSDGRSFHYILVKHGGKMLVVEMLVVEKKKATYADYAKLPEGANYQLIDGEIIEMPSPTVPHQTVVKNLAFEFEKFVREKKNGRILFAPMDVYFDDDNTFQPDVLFISNKRKKIISGKFIDGAPDLVVEVLSPGTAYYDLKKKKHGYEKFGVKEYWIIDVDEQTIEVYENKSSGFKLLCRVEKNGQIVSHVLVGLNLDAQLLFTV
jgi:Uma2 family endonuclease